MIIAISAAARTRAITRTGSPRRPRVPPSAIPSRAPSSPGRSTSRSRAAASAAVATHSPPVGARELADRDHVLDARARAAARRPRRGTPARPAPSSAISPSTATRRRARRALGEVQERRAHRHRVRVVAVVQEQPAAGKRELLLAELRELDLQGAGGAGTPRLSAAAHAKRVFSSWCAAVYAVSKGSGAPGSTRLTTMSVARQVRLEQRLVSGTIAMPPAGSASIASAFARATFSTVSTSSRCTGPTFVITHDVGPRERREPLDLPEPAHRQLGDAHLGVRVDPAERQRHADLGVVVRPRSRSCGGAGRRARRGCPWSTSCRSSP